MIMQWFRSLSRLPRRPARMRWSALFAVLCLAAPSLADSLVVIPIAEGVTLKMYKYDDLYGAKQEVFVIVADLNHPSVGVKFSYRRGAVNGEPYQPVPILAADIRHAVAAINTQFFDLPGKTGSVQYQKVDGVVINGPDSAGLHQGVIVRADGTVEIVWRPPGGWASLKDVPNITVSNDDLITNGAVRAQYPSGSHHTSRHPRTAAAWTYDNKLLLVVVDGRSTKSGGMTMEEWANYVATLGNIRNAFNYDGGGSSTTWANGTVWNTPSDGSLRPVANALVVTSNPFPSTDVIVDNPRAEVVGAWQSGTSSSDRYGPDYRFKSKGDGSAYLRFTPNLPAGGVYEVFAMYPRGANRTTAAPYIITHSDGETTVPVNQQVKGGVWNSLGTYSFAAGAGGSVRVTDGFPEADKVVIADAIRWAVPAPTPTTTTLVSSPIPTAVERPVTFIATVGAATGAPAGTVSFFDGVTEIGTIPLGANQRASFTTSSLSVGSHKIEAVYNGSEAHASSASVSFTKLIQPTGGCIPAPAGLMAWWPADGHYMDLASANPGAFALPFAPGYRGQAFRFDGSAGQVGTIPNTPSLHVSANGSGITLAAWIQPDDSNARPILEYGTPALGTNARGTWLWLAGGGALQGNIRSVSGLDYILQTDPATIIAGKWQHVAMTYDKKDGQMRLYRNGSVVAERRIGAGLSFRTQYPLGIGIRPNGSERFKGLQDEITLYDRALSPSEMLTLYNTGVGACEWDNLIAGAPTSLWAYKPSGKAVVSTPTVYNDRAYVVDSAGTLRALDARNGVPMGTFGSHTLDAPVRGRPTVSFAGGQGRLYLVTQVGTLYVKDLETGEDLLEPVHLMGTDGEGHPNAAESVSSPAVSETDAGLFAFAGVDDAAAGTGYIARVNLATRDVATLAIGTSVTSSPSITEDGVTVQIGAADQEGGRLLSLQTSDLTARMSLDTPASRFKAPPVVSVLDRAPHLMAGDTEGMFYCYNAANGALRWRSGDGGAPVLTGGVDQSAWVDYDARPNVVYVGTTTGRVYPLNAATGAAVAGTVSAATGGGVTGGPLRLNGRDGRVLYVPTVNGLFALPSGETVPRRFPVAPGSAVFHGLSSPSATSADPGGIIVVTAGNGTVYGLPAQ